MRGKGLAALLWAGLALVMLTGCSGKMGAAGNGGEALNGSTGVGTDGEGAGNNGAGNESSAQTVYPAGTVTIYGYGQPQYLQEYYDAWLERNKAIAPGVKIEIVQTEGSADTREKITMTSLAGADEDLPDAVYLDPVNIMDLANGGLLKDETDYVTPFISRMVSNASDDANVGGRIFGLPESVRPQELFYNKEIFDKYGIDPEMMKTMDGYVEAGRRLKEKSGGKVWLSYIDPGSKTWRYWGRRGLMPQASARIWDDSGNVVIGSDSGTKLALGTLDTMYKEGLLLKSAIMEPALYDSINRQEVATFYIGAFWDEFLRKNCEATAGQWRVMPAPVFDSVGTNGAPVSSYFTIVNKGDNVYAGLLEKLWHDFTFDLSSRTEWVKSMDAQNAPYANPVALDMLKEEFWKEPSNYYGGQSFREMEGKALLNGSQNLAVTPQDAQADGIISAELENYVAGNLSMDQAIANMDKNLKAKIGKAETGKSGVGESGTGKAGN